MGNRLGTLRPGRGEEKRGERRVSIAAQEIQEECGVCLWTVLRIFK
jgi:hypothetical protein